MIHNHVVKVKNISGLCHFGPAVGLHCLSVPSGADVKTYVAQGGKELVAIHRLTENSYIGLLDLSTHAETAVTWDDDDLREYSRKCHRVCDNLQFLKEYVHTPLQKNISTRCVFFFGIRNYFFPRRCILSRNCRV